MHRVSALGYALGYLGGGILFSVNVLMYLKPDWFGFSNGIFGIKASFLTVSIWWFLAFLPGFWLNKDKKPKVNEKLSLLLQKSINSLIQTGRDIRKYRNIVLFLAAYWLYIDGVGTVIRMAIDYGMSLGFDPSDLIKALLITQFVGFPASIAFGKLGDSIGAKNGIYIALAIYTCVSLYAYWMNDKVDFYGLAIAIGLAQGGIQALSRSLYAQITPKNQQTEFFGFFNMLGKFAAIIGPMFMGFVGYITKSPRISIVSIGLFFVIGGIILSFVKEANFCTESTSQI